MQSDAKQFIINVEDLVRKTVMLISLNHPNIIQVHGHAFFASSHHSVGYFILMDRLQDTLEERITC